MLFKLVLSVAPLWHTQEIVPVQLVPWGRYLQIPFHVADTFRYLSMWQIRNILEVGRESDWCNAKLSSYSLSLERINTKCSA
jgi:hypothetical protein